MNSIKGKVIALTGAASGIGRATAVQLASLGARLSLADANAKLLSEVEAELTAAHGAANIHAQAVDVRDSAAVNAWIDAAVAKFGPLDGAANAAGVLGTQQNVATMAEIDDQDWEFVMGVNAGGVMKCMRAQIPKLRDGGSIVNVASVAGLVGLPHAAAYHASKHAVCGLTKVAAKEFGARNLRVNAVAPGPIETPLLRDALGRLDANATPNFSTPIQRAGTADEVASLIIFLLTDESRYISGSVFPIDGGMTC
ncbi:3-oxoacyl-reductase [Sodiomyces alkalinus F11]|uniref:3-oxoacyl-reductase n=1 Tax=Sodiomyces alkalinus (strain CBS 110278 / VKM F-3762 / F11) TaxID=1314773 RepID=A0A3N2PIX8_SODAK|nr:3-oxoacyl-reductase [Sodiomyces alkalinus F11]ROT34501.1 3-oxoacyl-reductase [Sodiomyces alkalinus F11]